MIHEIIVLEINTRFVIEEFLLKYFNCSRSMAMYTDVLNVYGRLAFILPPQYYMLSESMRSVTWAAQSKNNPK